MINLATSLSLYSSTSINDALKLPGSMANKVLESKAFEGWKQAREAELKTQAAIVNRLNSVIQAVGIVAKVAAGRR
jgi:hypothetical protein